MKYQLKAIIIKNLKRIEGLLAEELVLIPRPKEISELNNKSSFLFTSDCTISFLEVGNKKIIINDLNEFLGQESSLKIKETDAEESDNVVLKQKSEWDLIDVNNEDCYNLEIISNRIIIYGLYEKGLFYGVQTLIQILKNSLLTDLKLLSSPKKGRERFIMSQVSIKDCPDLKIRGIAQDISRGQIFTIENAKRYIKMLSHYKMNFYCLYIEDVFAHPKHPLIGKNRGALTKKEIQEIDNYAISRHVELVPIFECLGHVDNILINKKYEPLGEFPGAQCLDVSNPEVLDFVTDYISEMSKCFSSTYFHIGCDESFDLGKNRSKEYIKENGKSKVLTDFYNKLYDIVRENGKRHVIMYDDIVRNDEYIKKKLNNDMILMYWNYAPKKKFSKVDKLLNAGHKVIVSPAMLNWERNFPDNHNASKNIINLTKQAYKNRNHGCLGVLTSTWGDQRYYSLRENEIFGAILTGGISWNTPDFNYLTFNEDYGFLFFGIVKETLKSFNEMFTSLSSSALHYYRFVLLLPPFFYTYLFKHPFNQEKYVPPFKKHELLGEIGEKCLQLYDKIQPVVIFEKENFEYIQFGAELAKYLHEKIKISVKVSTLLRTPEEKRGPQDIEEAITDIKYIQEKIRYLKERYEILWKRAAKLPNLEVIIRRFDDLIKWYDDKLNQLDEKTYFKSPYLESEWIWVNEKSCPFTPRYFRETIDLQLSVKKALIQCIACNYMKVHINGKYVGEVYGRLSLSILPISNRVKVFDITKYLKQGKNIIAIEAHNYEGYKGAINIYGEIQLEKGPKLEIFSDKAWLCNKKDIYEDTEWTKLEFDELKWKGVKSYGAPPNLNGDIYKPNLLDGEISDTQDYFGIQGYFYNLMDTFMSKFLKNRLKPLIPGIVNLLKPYGK